MIYFAQIADGGPIKIGRSTDVAGRLIHLRTALPWSLALIGKCEGGVSHENWLHNELKSFHVRGEWFHPDTAVLNLIEKVLALDWVWPASVGNSRRSNNKYPPPILIHAAQKLGGFAALAREIGVNRQAIYQWRRIPAERVLQVERITGIHRHELRPDLYPVELPRAAE